MNKISSERYELVSPSNHHNPQTLNRINQSQAITLLTNKQSHIDMIKRRISALCVREDRMNHKTLNNDLELEKRTAIIQQSLKIRLLLEKQRMRDAQKLEALKSKNLQRRVQSYYKSKTLKKQIAVERQQINQLTKTKSKEYTSIINSSREKEYYQKKNRKNQIYQSQLRAKEDRIRTMQEKHNQIQQIEKRQAEHIIKLGMIKDNQLNELDRLEYMMVEKNNSSKMEYEASVERLVKMPRKSSSNYYNSRNIINSARETTKSRISPSPQQF